MSQRLNLPEPLVSMTGERVRVPGDHWQSFWGTMTHAARNALGHGIETPQQRLSSGKSEAGTIELGAARSNGRLVFSLRDDGRGIDWDNVRAKGSARRGPSSLLPFHAGAAVGKSNDRLSSAALRRSGSRS